MWFRNRAWLLLAAVLLPNTGLAVTVNLKENYQPIIDRNPFGLKPPPPPPTNNAAPPPAPKPKMDIFLTGIVSVGHPKRPKKVFFHTKEQAKKDPMFYGLTEGVEKDGIKILEIDEINRKVRINTDVGETLLTFQTHGVAPPASAAPAPGQPGAVPIPGQPGAVPQPIAGGLPQGAPGFPQNQFPQGQPGGAAANAGGSAPGNFRSIPSRSVRSRIPAAGEYTGGGNLPENNPGAAHAPEQPPIDPAEQYLRMHLDKTQKERQGIAMPPLPPLQ